MNDAKITQLLQEWQGDDREALQRLTPLVIGELRRLAAGYFAREDPGHTLQPTALVNEVYLRLVGHQVGQLDNRLAFFAFAARLMREILVDHARARRATKRGGQARPIALDDIDGEIATGGGLDLETLLTLDEALDHLEQIDPYQRRLVELRYFGGLTMPEIAEILGVSVATAERRWSAARLWLARRIG